MSELSLYTYQEAVIQQSSPAIGKTLSAIATDSYEIIHATSGRIRVRIPRLKSDQQFASYLEWRFKSTNSIVEVRTNLAISCLIVTYSPDQIALADIKTLLEETINAEIEQDVLVTCLRKSEPIEQTEDYLLQKLGLPLLGLGAAVTVTTLEIPATLFVGGLILLSAIPLFTSTFKKVVSERKMNVDVLESFWTVLHTVEGAMVAPALALSMEGLWKVMRSRVIASPIDHEEIDLKLEGFFTHVKRQGQEQKVLIEEIQIGEQVIIYPGEMIPVDGHILKGKATVDEEKVTGTPEGVLRKEGEKVYASNLVVEGKLTVIAEKTGKDTQIGRLINLVNTAPPHETKIVDFAEDVGDLTIVPILTLSSVVFAFTGDIHRSLALLQLDFATGIRISTATAVLNAINYATQQCGVYIRSGHALELLGRLDTIVFDKTGTLTHIYAEVVDIQSIDDERISPLEILRLAAAAEQGLNHPSAKAIVSLAEQKGVLTQIEWEAWEYKIGRGVIAQMEGKRILLGSKKFLQKEGISFKSMRKKYPALKTSGHTHVYLAIQGELLGAVSLSNPIRPESAGVIASLHQYQIESYILTGDHAKAANGVAQAVGIPPSHIHVEALCEGKVKVLQELDAEGKLVAYVGEGMNDAVGLAYADLSISLAEGSQIARQTADVVLMNNNLEGLVLAIAIAKKAKQIIDQNIALVAIPNITVVMAGVILGLDPILAVLINSSFTILAEINALLPLTGVMEQNPNLPKSKPQI